MLRVRDLTVHRGGRLVLDGLGFDLPAGSALAVLGPNGAGKTTLLETVAGLLPASSGTVELSGRVLDRLPAYRRAQAGLRLVGEGRRVLPQLTVAENLRLGHLRGAAPARGDGGEVGWLALFPRLRTRWTVPAGQLSGGEQQMLALAMGLAAEPGVLLLDEPSFGLAPQVVDELFTALRRLREESAITLVLAEQHVQRALALCDRVLVIQSGRAVFDSAGDRAVDLERIVDGYLGRVGGAAAVPGRGEVTDLVSLRLPVELKRRLQLEARRRGAEPGDLVAEAVRDFVRDRR